jgi:hypothetical protein
MKPKAESEGDTRSAKKAKKKKKGQPPGNPEGVLSPAREDAQAEPPEAGRQESDSEEVREDPLKVGTSTKKLTSDYVTSLPLSGHPAVSQSGADCPPLS